MAAFNPASFAYNVDDNTVQVTMPPSSDWDLKYTISLIKRDGTSKDLDPIEVPKSQKTPATYDVSYTAQDEYIDVSCHREGYNGSGTGDNPTSIRSKELEYKCSHNWVLKYEVEETCTTDGYKVYECSNCGEEKTEYNYGSAYGHKYGSDGVCEECGSTAFSYEVSGNEIIITGYEGTDSEIEIPDNINGYQVVRLGYECFFRNNDIKSITIPSSVTSIGTNAFKDCSSLTDITILGIVTSIGYDAFNNTAYYNDSSNWENNVLYIGKHLIQAKDSISGEYNIKDGTAMIADDAFCFCTSLTNVTIPDSVMSIGDCAFDSCEGLTNIIIPHGIKSINAGTFYYCVNLSSIIIPDSVTSIGNQAFELCTSLESITIPDSVTSIGYSAFDGCRNLTSITIPDSVTSIGKEAFDGCEFESITISNNTTDIGDGAFNNPAGAFYVFFRGTKSQRDAIEGWQNYIEGFGYDIEWHYSLNGQVKTENGLKHFRDVYVVQKDGNNNILKQICDLKPIK